MSVRLLQRSPHDRPDHEQQVDRRDNHSCRGEEREPRAKFAGGRAWEQRRCAGLDVDSAGDFPGVAARLERREQAHELADKAVQARQADAGHREEDHERGPHGHPGRKAAEFVQRARVVPLVDHADEQEECARREAVVDHVQDRAGEADAVEGEQAQHAEAQVADRRVGHQFLDVFLHPADQPRIDDADDRQHTHDRGVVDGRDRAHAQRKAVQAVGAQFEQHAREDDRARRRRLRVGQRQPGMHREERHLHGEPAHQRPEDQALLVQRERSTRLGEGGEIERPVLREGVVAVRDIHQPRERDERAGEGEEEELGGRGLAVGRSEQVDEDVQRDQRELKEDVEDHHVACAEDAGHRGLEDQQPEVVGPKAVGDRAEGGQHADRPEQDGEADEQHAHGVEAE